VKEMKYIFLFVASILIFFGCSREEPLNFRIYDLDVYSMPFDEEATKQEVYASVKVEGFKTIKEADNYKFHILLNADLITPDNRKVESVAKFDTTGLQSEKYGKYLNLELSFILDETYPHGNYKLILKGIDQLSGLSSEVTEDFNLE
jgi:hypothetical protein